MEKEYKWMVRVSCMTFNHASYIEDAMNGFCMQETDFPFVCTIIDDASTDGEQEVIKRYLEENFDLEDRTIVRNEETEDYTLTFARHKTNTNCYFAVLYLKYNHYSIKKTKMPYIAEWHENCKYIAPCEGDDFWISPCKLQHQVDFLEKKTDCSAVFGNRLTANENRTSITRSYFSKKYYNIQNVMEGLMPGLQNVAYCTKSIDYNYRLPEINGDMCIYYQLAQNGKLATVQEDWAVYRRTGHGMASGRNSKDAWRISFEDRYKFHKVLGFKYNRQLVISQIYNLLAHIMKGYNLDEGISYIKMYSCPNKLMYLWVPIYTIKYFIQSINRRWLWKKSYLKE